MADALERLQAIAQQHDGELLIFPLSKYDETTLIRIEWHDKARFAAGHPQFIAGGEARGATPEQAALQMLLKLQGAGLV